MSRNRRSKRLAESKFGGDPEELLSVPIEFVALSNQDGFDEDDLALEAAGLVVFMRGFFRRWLKEIIGIEVDRFDGDTREEVSDKETELELAEEKKHAWGLLDVCVDFCELIEDTEGMSTPEEIGEHEAEVLELAQRTLDELSDWASEADNAPIASKAGELASELQKIKRKYS